MRNKFNREHILSICDKKYEYTVPSIKAQDAVAELCRYFLGNDWYYNCRTTNMLQLNTKIITEIETNYKGAKIGWFKRKRYNFDRIFNKIYNHSCKCDDCEGCTPPMKAHDALNELCEYFLGDDWYDDSSLIYPEQVNVNIICEIEKRYKGYKYKKK